MPVRRRKATGRKGKRLQPFSAAEAASWYDGLDLSIDWTSWHFPTWARLLKRYRTRPARVLEIGSWEGRSALFFLNHLPRSRLTCVDTFAGGQEHREDAARNPEDARFLRSVQRRFDRNTRAFERRIEKMVMKSTDALAELAVRKRQFDIAYVDGGHRAVEAYSDGVLTWPLIARGGIVMFDDYQWKDMPNRFDRPKAGIDAFLASIEGQYRLVHKEYQIAIVKR